MTATVKDLLNRALKLSEKDRAELAHRLIVSLDDGPLNGPDDPAWMAAWAEELERRASDYEQGKVKSKDALESIERIRKKLKAKRVS